MGTWLDLRDDSVNLLLPVFDSIIIALQAYLDVIRAQASIDQFLNIGPYGILPGLLARAIYSKPLQSRLVGIFPGLLQRQPLLRGHVLAFFDGFRLRDALRLIFLKIHLSLLCLAGLRKLAPLAVYLVSAFFMLVLLPDQWNDDESGKNR